MSTLLVLLAALPAAGTAPEIDFDTEIIPVLTRAGCNSGACHGSAAGRGGFRLSLYGSNAAADYRALVFELEGRRVNLASPEKSLVYLKATETISHGGGFRLDPTEAGAEKLLGWITGGAPRLRSRHLQEFDVTPAVHVAENPGSRFQLRAAARFDNGDSEDVTRWTVFTAEDAAAVEIDNTSATATLLRRGRHIVVARYLDRVVPIQLVVPLSEERVDLSDEPRSNFADEHVLDLLSTLRIPVSPPADDAVFLRRICLDLTGRLPEPEQVRSFLRDEDPHKRERLIDRLLVSEEFTEYWTYRFAELLRIRPQPQDEAGALAFHDWLRAQIKSGTPYNRVAKELLTSSGDTRTVGPANFYRTVAGPREQAEFVSELFMGSRLRCANCHNHPLDKWTQDDYHGLAAVFAKLERGRVVKVGTRGEVTHPGTGEAAVPRIPGERFLDTTGDGRQRLAQWLTDSENPYFAKAIVNRLWKALLGRGLVEPVDDLRATNPATHPALLDHLAADFIDNGFSIRHTLKLIATSATYARSARTSPGNRSDDRFYSHALERPLPAEVLADALADVTGVADRYGEQPLGTRAVTLFDPKIPSEALDVLGRCSREDSCEATTTTSAGGLSRTLHLVNGPLINRKISAANGRLAKLIAEKNPPVDVVEEFYVRALGRIPMEQEREFWQREIDGATDTQGVLEDFLWSLLTSREFVTNH